MVITTNDIAHLSVMQTLAEKTPFPSDYEPCGECGYDHSYEYGPAHKWHMGNPCSYCKYDHEHKKHEVSCPTMHYEKFQHSPKSVFAEKKSLESNLLNLCAALKDKGFDTYAESLEQRFLLLKEADVHMYRVHDEDGEDLIEFAHPDGDTNMGDGELGDVETIVSQHNKIKKMVQKEPTGKLAQYVEMCKLVLAQDANKDAQYISKANAFIEKKRKHLRDNMAWVGKFVSANGDLKWYGSGWVFDKNMENLIKALSGTMHIPEIDKAIEHADFILKAVDGDATLVGSVPSAGMPKELRDKVEPTIREAQSTLARMKEIALKVADLEKPKEDVSSLGDNVGMAPSQSDDATDPDMPSAPAINTAPLMAKLQEAKAKWPAMVKERQIPADKQQAMTQWFTKTEAEIKAVKTQAQYDELAGDISDFGK